MYTNGCSFTNHYPQPDTEKWPHHLGKELGISEVINDGLGGSGNPGIFKRTAKFLSSYQGNHHTDILAVVQLTFPFRFEMPSPNTLNGWQQYMTMRDDEEIRTHFASRGDSNLEYYMARLRSFAEHESYEAWEFYIQACAISNLFATYNIDSFFINVSCPPANTMQPISGKNRGNLWEEINFSDRYINWLWDDGDGTVSNLNHLIKKLNMPMKNGVPGYQISKDDIHFNSEANLLLAKGFCEQIKHRLNTDNKPTKENT